MKDRQAPGLSPGKRFCKPGFHGFAFCLHGGMVRKHGITLFQLALLLVAAGLLLAAFFCYAEWTPGLSAGAAGFMRR